MRNVLIVALIAASVPAAAQTFYRCEGPDGSPVFSDHPCGISAEQIHVEPPQRNKSEYERRREAEAAQNLAREAERRAAERARQAADAERSQTLWRKCWDRREQKDLRIGMTREHLYASPVWGLPDDVTTHRFERSITENFVYKCEGHKSIRIYLRNGVVTSVHN